MIYLEVGEITLAHIFGHNTNVETRDPSNKAEGSMEEVAAVVEAPIDATLASSAGGERKAVQGVQLPAAEDPIPATEGPTVLPTTADTESVCLVLQGSKAAMGDATPGEATPGEDSTQAEAEGSALVTEAAAPIPEAAVPIPEAAVPIPEAVLEARVTAPELITTAPEATSVMPEAKPNVPEANNADPTIVVAVGVMSKEAVQAAGHEGLDSFAA